MGVREGSEGGAGVPHTGCAGRFLRLETRPLAALLEVCFAQAPWLQASAVGSQRFVPLIYRGSATGSIAHSMKVSPLVCPVIL